MTQPTRRAFLASATALLAASAASSPAWAGRKRSRRRPNIVLIVADDLPQGGLGAYGQQVLRTPHLDRMAQEGIAFTEAYSGAPMCAPSRCAQLTGMHTGHARVRDNSFTATGLEPELLPEDVTWGQVLQGAGYRTGAFGKWGFGPDDCYVPLGVDPVGTGSAAADAGGPRGDLQQNVGHSSHPLQKGFDEFLGLVRHHHATEGYWPTYLWHGNERVPYPENEGGAQRTYAPDVYVGAALDFMRRHQDRPFAVYLAPQLVHWPNHVPDTSPYDDEPWTDEMKRYAAMYTRLDEYVGQVRAHLERLGLADDTLIFFTSDNGTTEERAAVGGAQESNALSPSPDSAVADELWQTSGGLRGRKHSLYEGGIRVPMIVWGPGHVRKDGAAVAGHPWAGQDLLPTFAEAAGARAPSDVDGRSVLGLITGAGAPAPRPLYWERSPYPGANVDGSPPAPVTFSQAVRDGRWKAVRWPVAGSDPETPDAQWRFELYDLQADRGETRDVALLHPDLRPGFERLMRDSHAAPPYQRAPWPPR